MRLNHLLVTLLPAFIYLLLWSPSAQPAPAAVTLQRDGAVAIGGRTMRCGNVRNRLDPQLDNLGLSIPDRSMLILNPALLSREPETVRLFVFTHECGHHHVGGSELGADCWAVKQGVREGWLNKDGLKQVCRSFGNMPETPTHPSAARRCRNLDVCFGEVTAQIDREQRAVRPRPEPSAVSSSRHDAPTLVAGPTLLRAGGGH
jgi:hypothetical protein